MARAIDLDQPLSDEDRQYLVVRDRWSDIARADGHHDPRRARREAEQARTALTQQAMPVTVPTASPPAQQPADPSTADDAPYEEWTYPELQAELKERKLAAGGKQEELIQRLYDDDEKNAQE